MAVNGSFNATSQSDFGRCATFDELTQDNVIQGAYTCSPPRTSSSSPTSSIFPETTSTPPSGDSSSSLSTGAKVVISVCVPVAITTLSALLFSGGAADDRMQMVDTFTTNLLQGSN